MDDSWLIDKNRNPEPLGVHLEGMRKWGIRPKTTDKDGRPCEPFSLVLMYCPDPWNAPKDRYLVIDARSYKPTENDRWHDEVHIQIPGGEIQRLTDNELQAARNREQWPYKRETVAEQRRAAVEALESLKAIGIKI